MKTVQDTETKSSEHIRVRLMRHLLKIGQAAIAESTDIPACATPRIQAYLARERLWIIDLSCGLSPVPAVCKRFICGKIGSTCLATQLPVQPNQRFEGCEYAIYPEPNVNHHNHNASILA